MTTQPFEAEEGDSEYRRLEYFAAVRREELSGMLTPYIEVTDAYGRLLCRLVWILGHSPPEGPEDSVRRDLLADIFDVLYESRAVILAGKLSPAFPLIRRAFESLSLFTVCTTDPAYARRWAEGEELRPVEVRKALTRQPFAESEEELRELYKFFSQGSHPNRAMIAVRFLGEGNQFVLGSISQPDLFFVADYCLRHLELWQWFGAVASFSYKEVVAAHDPAYPSEYRKAHEGYEKTRAWLHGEYMRLWEVRRTEDTKR